MNILIAMLLYYLEPGHTIPENVDLELVESGLYLSSDLTMNPVLRL